MSRDTSLPVAAGKSAEAGAARRSDRRPGQTIRKVLDAGLAELRESSYANLTMRAV
ncbi:MAG TPA: TetR/AcrR family transcriptional regulator, partial [Mycobacterium sp.]|nr:TetR/AcrR family transcriptional regulator [Mycobacterium sp.]